MPQWRSSYLERLPAEKGVRRDIDDNGNLLIRRMGKAAGRAQAAAGAAGDARLARSGDAGAAAMKLLRTIRLDPSDTFVFETAAEPGEWAVSGAFVFWNSDPAALEGKARSAFRGGFLGVASLGWSTLVQIVEASAGDRAGRWSTRWRSGWSRISARQTLRTRRAAAEEEVAFAESLCNQPQDTLIAVHRSFEDGEVREILPHAAPAQWAEAGARVLLPRGGRRGRAQPGEAVDLIGMAERERK